jgi:hypothetical protein
MRALPVLLLLALVIYSLIDCIQSDEGEVRRLPKGLWILVIVLAPLLGAVAWLFLGRPKPSRPMSPPASPRPLAPDDDPDFLRGLGHGPHPPRMPKPPDPDEDSSPDSPTDPTRS